MSAVFERLKGAARADWSRYVEHEFVQRMGDGTLPDAAFRRYLVQDYLFLIQFARANALAAYKSRTLADMRRAQGALSAIPALTISRSMGPFTARACSKALAMLSRSVTSQRIAAPPTFPATS